MAVHLLDLDFGKSVALCAIAFFARGAEYDVSCATTHDVLKRLTTEHHTGDWNLISSGGMFCHTPSFSLPVVM